MTWRTSLRECCSCTPEDSSWASCDVLLGYRTTGYAKGLSSDLPQLAFPLTTYLGNSVLWEGRYRDQGVYFDRGPFVVTLA